MCKVGDVIVIDKYISDDGTVLSRHSFVVIDDNTDEIKGLKYDFVANVMSSFKDEKHKHRKLKYKENVGVTSDDLLDELIRLIVELEVENKLKQNTKNIEVVA